MLRDFARFLFAVWNEWKVLLTGGSLIALLAIVSTVRGKPMPTAINWLLLGVTLITAAFFAWRKEWIENQKEFIDVTPLQMTMQLRDVTGVAASSRTKPFLNKLIRVTGTVQQVAHMVFPLSYIRLQYEEGQHSVGITMELPRWKAKMFIPLPKGTVVTVIGRVKEISSFDIRLTNAELVSAEAPQASTLDQQSPPPSQG